MEWNVDRTGVIAPRAVHNAADIARRGLMIGDHVTVKKAGDVIPRVEAPAATPVTT
ncbi:hypothetical protein [Actinoallomurus sp. NPDC052274]|uniref:hypothetical protein n=1 Tax=Actinoallomurus sp. NPDC052274 TaxID=3155420 RepID=UPI00343668CE